MNKLFFFLLLPLSYKAFSQNSTSEVKFYNPGFVFQAKGYSNVVEIDLGQYKMVVISGQTALDSNGNLIGKDNLTQQTEHIFANIKKIVSGSGGTMDDLIKVGIFMTDIAQAQKMREVRNKYLNLSRPPASTLVEVSKLIREDLLIEIEATAIIPKRY